MTKLVLVSWSRIRVEMDMIGTGENFWRWWKYPISWVWCLWHGCMYLLKLEYLFILCKSYQNNINITTTKYIKLSKRKGNWPWALCYRFCNNNNNQLPFFLWLHVIWGYDQKYNNHRVSDPKEELGRRVKVLRGSIRHKRKNVLHCMRLGKVKR